MDGTVDGRAVVGDAVALNAKVGGLQHHLALGAGLLLGVFGAVDGLGDEGRKQRERVRQVASMSSVLCDLFSVYSWSEAGS